MQNFSQEIMSTHIPFFSFFFKYFKNYLSLFLISQKQLNFFLYRTIHYTLVCIIKLNTWKISAISFIDRKKTANSSQCINVTLLNLDQYWSLSLNWKKPFHVNVTWIKIVNKNYNKISPTDSTKKVYISDVKNYTMKLYLDSFRISNENSK